MFRSLQRLLLVAILIAAATGPALAGTPSYEFRVLDVTAASGGIYSQTVELTVNNDFGVSGWSVSVCHDSSLADVCGSNSTAFTENLAFGTPLFFKGSSIDDRATVIPGSTDGANQGIVIDQGGVFFFPSDSTHPILTVDYIADDGVSGMTATTTICNDVGSPPVQSVVVCCGGASVPISDPSVTAVNGIVTYATAAPLWQVSAADANFSYDTDTGVASIASLQVDINIANTASNTEWSEIAGFAISVTHDSALLTPTAVNLGSIPSSIVQNTENLPGDVPAVFNCDSGVAGNTGADIVITNITATGVSIAVLNTDPPSAGPPPLPYCLVTTDYGTGGNAASIEYTPNASSLIGLLTPTQTTLAFEDAGDGVGNSIKVPFTTTDGFNFRDVDTSAAGFSNVLVTFAPQIDLDFIRGDCNEDGFVNIADPIWTLSGYLIFPPIGPQGNCAAACDANNDGGIDVADVSYTLIYRFSNGPVPPAPFPNCGQISGVDCDAYAACP